MPDGGAKPGTAAMIVASTSRNPGTGKPVHSHRSVPEQGQRCSITAQANERASWTPTCRFGWPARFGETLATKKWWIHLLRRSESTTSLCGSSAPLLLHRLFRGLCLVLDVLSR